MHGSFFRQYSNPQKKHRGEGLCIKAFLDEVFQLLGSKTIAHIRLNFFEQPVDQLSNIINTVHKLK